MCFNATQEFVAALNIPGPYLNILENLWQIIVSDIYAKAKSYANVNEIKSDIK